MPTGRPIKAQPEKSSWHWYEYATWLAYSLAVLVLLAGGTVLLKPHYDAILGSRRQIDHAREQRQQKALLKSRIETLLANATAVSPQELGFLEYMLPSGPDLPGLFYQTEQLTASSGMTLSNLDLAEQGQRSTNAPQGVLAIPMAMTYETHGRNAYEILKQSLAALESNLRLFDVVSFTFDAKEEGAAAAAAESPSEKKQMQMKLETYYFTAQ